MTIRGYGRGYAENLRPRILTTPACTLVPREIGPHPDIEMLNACAKRHITSMDDPHNPWKGCIEIDSEMTDDQKGAIRSM